ncbi:FecR family protein [Leptospira interrogans]|uniref:FecR family protein n=1 Tax=Leptospira interrogans TaxID=173 RepID=UPI0002BAB4FB|nr:FecR family protein [Leptospira interrogans]MCR8648200.1 iron dicitrate transport regulator FecR [Leptospira interrogans serovar Bataviae]OAM85524.1 iron dicitrate transport regulator FecR [Leptospira interrogans serovar Bataviae]QOI39385.1 FecR domain-containing protein [Leptospira interrogans serovar Bataviae]QYY59651.1 FecR family protein [Leptospira interrogans serovar Bataviae]
MKDKILSGDKPILFLLIFNIVLFTGVFIYDYTRYGYQGSQKVIGTILYKSNTTRRKYDSEVVWKEIEVGNSVQNRDTIVTSEGSQAKIRLLDGSEIMIAENSMIFIDYLDNRANLEISAGGLQVTRKSDNKENTSSLGIRSGDGVLKLVEGVVNVEKKKDQRTLDYAILSGAVKPDPSNPFPMSPKKSLDGFEKLFPGSENIQTVKSIQAATSAVNSNSSVNTNSATNPGPHGTNITPSIKSENTTTKSQNTGTDSQSKPGLKTERIGSSGNKNQNEVNSKADYDPGDYIKKQKYEHKVQEKSDSSAVHQNKTEFKPSESTQAPSKSGKSSYPEVKKQRQNREWTPEELLRQEKEKRRREREDKEQREFLRM